MQSYIRRGSSVYRKSREARQKTSENDPQTKEKPKLYKIRWFMLFLYCMSNFSNSFQWIECSSIENIVAEFYQVSPTAVDSLSMIFYIGYCLFSLPASYILNKKGMRFTTLVGIGGTALAGWIKVLSVSPNRYYVTVIGQVVVSIAQCFVFGINAEMAASWFGQNEMALADGFGALGAQFGIAAGFGVPPYLVTGSNDSAVVETQLRSLFFATSIVPTVFFILILFFFKERPPTPPSYAVVYAAEVKTDFKESLKNVFTNINFILLLFAYSICQAVLNNVSTLINPLVLGKFPNQEQQAGNIGLTSTVVGFIGTPIVGFIIDRYPIYKEISIVLYILMIAAFLGFALCLNLAMLIGIYITMAIFGIACTAFYTFGFQYSAELTFPEPESLSGYLISIGTYIFSVVDLLIASWLMREYSALHSNLYHCAFLTLGLLLTIFIRGILKRNEIEKRGSKCCESARVVAADPSSPNGVFSASPPITGSPFNVAVIPILPATAESYISMTVSSSFMNNNAKDIVNKTNSCCSSEDVFTCTKC